MNSSARRLPSRRADNGASFPCGPISGRVFPGESLLERDSIERIRPETAYCSRPLDSAQTRSIAMPGVHYGSNFSSREYCTSNSIKPQRQLAASARPISPFVSNAKPPNAAASERTTILASSTARRSIPITDWSDYIFPRCSDFIAGDKERKSGREDKRSGRAKEPISGATREERSGEKGGKTA